MTVRQFCWLLGEETGTGRTGPVIDKWGSFVALSPCLEQRGELETYTLVFPHEANIANGKLSILAPIGTAILGYRVGDVVRWRVPSGRRSLRVEAVLYQPEREGALPL